MYSIADTIELVSDNSRTYTTCYVHMSCVRHLFQNLRSCIHALRAHMPGK
jgi:hypothetical protein